MNTTDKIILFGSVNDYNPIKNLNTTVTLYINKVEISTIPVTGITYQFFIDSSYKTDIEALKTKIIYNTPGYEPVEGFGIFDLRDITDNQQFGFISSPDGEVINNLPPDEQKLYTIYGTSDSINATLEISGPTKVLFTGYTLNPLDGGGKATLYINGQTSPELTVPLTNNNQFIFDLKIKDVNAKFGNYSLDKEKNVKQILDETTYVEISSPKYKTTKITSFTLQANDISPIAYGVSPTNNSTELSSTFAQEIKNARTKSGLSVEDFATNSGLDATVLSAIEDGSLIPSPDEQAIIRIAITPDINKADAKYEIYKTKTTDIPKIPESPKPPVIINQITKPPKPKKSLAKIILDLFLKALERLIPFLLKMFKQFGLAAAANILSKVDYNSIDCPSSAQILKIIDDRNKLVTQINNLYKLITVLTKITQGLTIFQNALNIGIATILANPTPTMNLTAGIVSVFDTAKEKLQLGLSTANSTLNIINSVLIFAGSALGAILAILSRLDDIITYCAADKNIPFEVINTELSSLVNTSTGINNSKILNNDNTYKGFKLEIILVQQLPYPKRYAQALTTQGVPVLKTESSFASDPQVLLDQLKFIIDSNPNLTAE
jgi:transcriptional regulator with XRE-family HTH domain